MTLLEEPNSVVKVHRFTLDQYHAMIEMGLLREDSNVEFIEGVVVNKISKNPEHTRVLRMLVDAMYDQVDRSRFIIQVQDPVTMARKDSEPEPDIVIARKSDDDFAGRHVFASEVALVIEVAETSDLYDRGIKRRLYGSQGIPAYLLVSIEKARIDLFTDPTDDGYAIEKTWQLHEEVRFDTSDLSLVIKV